jgi:hypothetical protein
MLSTTKLTLITKNLEPHVEWHNSTLSNLNEFVQYDLIHPYFFQNKLNYSLRLPDSAAFMAALMDEYGTGQISPSFQFLGSPSFIMFFKQNMIDVPQCFQKSTSLLNKQNNLLMLKFVTFIMRHGLKLKVTRHFLRAVSRMLTPSPHARMDFPHTNWKSVFLSLSFLTRQGNYRTLVPLENEVLRFTNRLTATAKSISTSSNAFSELFKHFAKVEPIFSFYIYKVDKKIFKNTRGKSGKYTFIWKYIPPYKRKFFVFAWLIRELRLKNGNNLSERLQNLFDLFGNQPTKTWAYRVKRFSYNYVYRNCRFTLAETYRTVTK